MKILAVTEMVQRRLGAFDQDSPYDDRDVLAIADGCRGMYISQKYRQTGEVPAGDFIRPYEVDVTDDPTTGLKQIKLPIRIANGVDNLGIRSITNPIAPFIAWNPIQVGRASQFRLEDLGGIPAYWLEGQRIKVMGANGVTTARMLLIPCLLELDDDEEIFGDAEVEGIIADMTVQKMMLKYQTPEINANDGAGNI